MSFSRCSAVTLSSSMHNAENMRRGEWTTTMDSRQLRYSIVRRVWFIIATGTRIGPTTLMVNTLCALPAIFFSRQIRLQHTAPYKFVVVESDWFHFKITPFWSVYGALEFDQCDVDLLISKSGTPNLNFLWLWLEIQEWKVVESSGLVDENRHRKIVDHDHSKLSVLDVCRSVGDTFSSCLESTAIHLSVKRVFKKHFYFYVTTDVTYKCQNVLGDHAPLGLAGGAIALLRPHSCY